MLYVETFITAHAFLFYFFFFNDTATTEIYTLSYTTLFRSPAVASRWTCAWMPGDKATRTRRSEEHTSELQSQSNLVCRLLLEKKKTKILKETASTIVFLCCCNGNTTMRSMLKSTRCMLCVT